MSDDSDTLATLLDNVIIAQSLAKDLRDKANDQARSYLYDRRKRLAAQPDASPVSAVLVPREPTPAMLDASIDGCDVTNGDDFRRAVWSTMINARPVRQSEVTLGAICRSIADDYQSSEAHHPDHVLIAKEHFESMCKALFAPPRPWQVKDFADGWIDVPDEEAARRLSEEQSGAAIRPRGIA